MRISKNEQAKRQQEISFRIKDMMNRRHCTQRELAKSANISTGSMSQKLNNPGTFRVDDLYRIANVLNVSYEWIVGAERNGG